MKFVLDLSKTQQFSPLSTEGRALKISLEYLFGITISFFLPGKRMGTKPPLHLSGILATCKFCNGTSVIFALAPLLLIYLCFHQQNNAYRTSIITKNISYFSTCLKSFIHADTHLMAKGVCACHKNILRKSKCLKLSRN